MWIERLHKLSEALYQVLFEANCAQSVVLKGLTQLPDLVPRQCRSCKVAARLQLPANAELMLAVPWRTARAAACLSGSCYARQQPLRLRAAMKGWGTAEA